jgi:hypothetical protein
MSPNHILLHFEAEQFVFSVDFIPLNHISDIIASPQYIKTFLST